MQHFQERQFLETSSKTHVSHTLCNVTWNSNFFFSFKHHSGGALFRLCNHLHHHHIPAQQCYPSSNDDVISRLQMTNSHTHPHDPACSVDFRGSYASLVKTFNTRWNGSMRCVQLGHPLVIPIKRQFTVVKCAYSDTVQKKKTELLVRSSGILPASIHGDETQAEIEDDSPALDGRRHARRVSTEGSRRARETACGCARTHEH